MTDLAILPRDGSTYLHPRDGERLARQHNRIFALMKDGFWRSLRQISETTGDPEASCSARLRDFKKPRFQALYGAYSLERRYVRRGLWEYRLALNRVDLFA